MMDILLNIKNEGMGYTTETLFEFAYRGLKIVEIPINLNSRKFGQSKVRLVAVTRSIMLCIIKYMLRKIQISERIIKSVEKFIH